MKENTVSGEFLCLIMNTDLKCFFLWLTGIPLAVKPRQTTAACLVILMRKIQLWRENMHKSPKSPTGLLFLQLILASKPKWHFTEGSLNFSLITKSQFLANHIVVLLFLCVSLYDCLIKETIMWLKQQI